jgi:glycosyltransferase involved in cell wall biosynthesis
LPVLEAMASGTPVVAIAGTPAEEIADGAAVTFVAAEVEEFARGILDALHTDPVLTEHGVAVAESFTWGRVARLHDEVYGELT